MSSDWLICTCNSQPLCLAGDWSWPGHHQLQHHPQPRLRTLPSPLACNNDGLFCVWLISISPQWQVFTAPLGVLHELRHVEVSWHHLQDTHLPLVKIINTELWLAEIINAELWLVETTICWSVMVEMIKTDLWLVNTHSLHVSARYVGDAPVPGQSDDADVEIQLINIPHQTRDVSSCNHWRLDWLHVHLL